MTQKQTQAVLFDTDGVLIQHEQYFSYKLASELNISNDAIEAFFLSQSWKECVTGQADLKEEIAPWLSKWGWNKSVDALLKHWFETEDVPNKQLIDYIPQLQSAGISCYLATNQEKYRSFYLHEKMGFGKLMDYCFFSYEIKAKKPDEKYWQYIWDSLQYLADIDEKSHIMLWDDTQKNVEAASTFGFTSHFFKSTEQCITTLKQLATA